MPYIFIYVSKSWQRVINLDQIKNVLINKLYIVLLSHEERIYNSVMHGERDRQGDDKDNYIWQEKEEIKKIHKN